MNGSRISNGKILGLVLHGKWEERGRNFLKLLIADEGIGKSDFLPHSEENKLSWFFEYKKRNQYFR